MFGFSGFESATSLGGEAKNPLHTIPRAILGSVLLAGFFFVSTAYIEILGFHGTGASLASTEEPLTFLSQQVGVGLLGDLVALGALLSFLSCVLGSINPAARICFTMARHGLFPTALGSTHRSNRTPHHAVTVCSLILFIVPTMMAFGGIKLFESMGYLGAFASYGFLTVYILVSIAAPVYLYKIRKLQLRDLAIASAAIVFMMIPLLGSIGIEGNAWFPIPEAPYNSFPYLFMLYLALTCSWFSIQRLRFPGLARRMQRHIEDTHSQFIST
ncbi:MAG: APC family permease [Cyanobacteriota bacterium]|jgi:amino acid transporter